MQIKNREILFPSELEGVTDDLPLTLKYCRNIDFNTIKTTGLYGIYGNNDPSGTADPWYCLIVLKLIPNSDAVIQIAISAFSAGICIRRYTSNVWSAWTALHS